VPDDIVKSAVGRRVNVADHQHAERASWSIFQGCLVKPSRFKYHRAESVDEAIRLLENLGEDAKLIAGGQSLVPMMNFRLARPTALVDIGRIPGLSFIRLEDDGLRIGALTPHRAIEATSDPEILKGYSMLTRAARWIGHPPIRTRGTFGGSLAHADPAAEWCILALLLDAEVVVAGPSGTRTIAASDLFVGFLTTALAPNEMILEARFPNRAPHSSFHEFARRQGDFAVVAAAVWLDLDGRACRSGRIVLGGVASTPVRASEAEAILTDAPLDPARMREAAGAAAAALTPIADVHGSSAYRRQLASVLVRRALEDAARGGLGRTAEQAGPGAGAA
jgi:carbon-monoxide dehydrogenase medium subunit